MNRSHVREDRSAPDALPEIPKSSHPNYITPQGLERMRQRLADAEARLAAVEGAADDAEPDRSQLAREVRWLQGRIASAIPIDGASRRSQRVGFGSVVTVVDDEGREHRYRIVGEDEADPDHGLVSWVSPLARALEGTQVGDVAIWRRPAGDLEVEVVAIGSGN